MGSYSVDETHFNIVFIKGEKLTEAMKFLRCVKLSQIPGEVYIHKNNKLLTEKISQQEKARTSQALMRETLLCLETSMCSFITVGKFSLILLLIAMT